MFIPMPTAFGPRLTYHPARLYIPTDPVAAMQFARDLDRVADWHLSEGRRGDADRLSNLALEARARAAGGAA